MPFFYRLVDFQKKTINVKSVMVFVADSNEDALQKLLDIKYHSVSFEKHGTKFLREYYAGKQICITENVWNDFCNKLMAGLIIPQICENNIAFHSIYHDFN